MIVKRKRKVRSIKNELLVKSREAMLCAVQIFNNPNISFKSESFIVLQNIAWTYLLHAYFRGMKVEYRYWRQAGKRRKFDKTTKGAHKYWELERCLNDENSPVDEMTGANLRFLIGLRNEIEHKMTTKIDDYLSARFQASCLNFNNYIKNLFGEEFGIDKYLSFSLQFSTMTEEQVSRLRDVSDLPKNIATYITDFDKELSEEEFNDPRYSFRVLYVQKTVNKKGQADRVIEFIRPDSPEAIGLNREYRSIQDREKPKHIPSDIVKKMKGLGFIKFGMHQHTELWKKKEAKRPDKGFGVLVAKCWYWYDSWVQEVERHCEAHRDEFM